MNNNYLHAKIATCVAVFAVLAGFVRPAVAGDPSNGKRLAERWCAACHVVSANQREANADAPPFEEIANDQTLARPALQHFSLIRMQKCRT
jgi:mono/diheme cytochrome c family protein